MNTKSLLLPGMLVCFIFYLAACAPRPPVSPAAHTPTVTPVMSATHAALVELTLTPTASLRSTPPGIPSAPASLPIVYYYFIAVKSNTYPAGSVVILPDELILGPTLSKISRSPDPLTNISAALQAMLNDPRNAWKSDAVSITSLTFEDEAAHVDLQGQYTAPGDIVLVAARYQILLTVFAEQAVQSAVVTLNGENIANLGISNSRQAKPSNYSYTRAEIETFMAENAYMP